MEQTQIPAIIVTNYQQYINADILQQAIIDNIPAAMNEALPESIYVSIAYLNIGKQPKSKGVYKTTLVLNIKGKAYRYSLLHANEELYLAKAKLDSNNYTMAAEKDNHIQLLQQTFDLVVFTRAGKIANDLIANYKK